MKITHFVFLSLLASTGFVSCKKKGCTNPTASNYSIEATKDDGSCSIGSYPTAPNYVPSFTGTYAALIAIKTQKTENTANGVVDKTIGTAIAVFSENGGISFVSTGTLNANNQNLSINSNAVYQYLPSSDTPTGIAYNSQQNWSSTGGTWPSFTLNSTLEFATVTAITSGNIELGKEYTITTNQLSNADSVYLRIVGQKGSVQRLIAANNTNHTFSSEELSTLGAGKATAQIIGLKYDHKVIDTRDYYLIHQTVRTREISVK